MGERNTRLILLAATVSGVGLAVWGVWLIYFPAALIVAGTALVVFAVRYRYGDE